MACLCFLDSHLIYLFCCREVKRGRGESTPILIYPGVKGKKRKKREEKERAKLKKRLNVCVCVCVLVDRSQVVMLGQKTKSQYTRFAMFSKLSRHDTVVTTLAT